MCLGTMIWVWVSTEASVFLNDVYKQHFQHAKTESVGFIGGISRAICEVGCFRNSIHDAIYQLIVASCLCLMNVIGLNKIFRLCSVVLPMLELICRLHAFFFHFYKKHYETCSAGVNA